jgi:hypothetical protein
VETLAAASTIDTELVAPARLEIDQAPPVN